jgi:hypothetical protein
MNERRTRQDPKRYLFSDEDRARYQKRFWRMPRRLVTQGMWARLWRAEGTKRGGGVVTSVLPVLALHTFEGKKNMDGDNAGTASEPGWTGWTYLSRRRIARLAGVDKDAATRAMRRLASLDLLQIRRVPRAKYEGGYQTYYRLAAELYPAVEGEDPYAEISGSLIYGGAWSVLPTAAARHVYLVLACLDQIGDENAYLAKIEEDFGTMQWEELDFASDVWETLSAQVPPDLADDHFQQAWIDAIKREMLSRRRMANPVSLTELQHLTRLTRGTVIEALQVLTKPIFGDSRDATTGVWTPPIALVVKGRVDPRRPTWYAPDRRAWSWYWRPELLNNPGVVAGVRSRNWPELPSRRARMTSVLNRLSSPSPTSAWDEACDLQDLRTRRARNRMPHDTNDLARATRRTPLIVEQSLKIAAALTPAVLQAGGVGADDLKLLSRAALHRAAKAPDENRRGQVLGDELQRVRERASR